MQIAKTQAKLDAALATARAGNRRIALVPTMGNLHAGHLALVDRAKREADVVVVSIFVNPLQFGTDEDFDRYPRTLEEDLRLLAARGVDVVFAPTVETVYPQGHPPNVALRVSGVLADCLEGAFRPGHFDGVATVVWILLSRVRPHVAVFGEKDWQQLQVIRQLVAGFGSTVRVLGAPIVRAADGLALSSRNQYLSIAERAVAPHLHAALAAVGKALSEGRRDFAELCGDPVERLAKAGFRPQYLEIRQPDMTPAAVDCDQFVVLAAVWLGRTRLIDNLHVDGTSLRA